MATTTMPTAATSEKASFWIRFLGIAIDGIVVTIVGSILNGATSRGEPTTGAGFSALLGIFYYVYFWSSYGKGQTLGSRVVGIRVVKTDGTYLDLVGAFLRYVGWVISCVCLFIGVIWAAFDAQKQGWHDKIAGTYVVKA